MANHAFLTFENVQSPMHLALLGALGRYNEFTEFRMLGGTITFMRPPDDMARLTVEYVVAQPPNEFIKSHRISLANAYNDDDLVSRLVAAIIADIQEVLHEIYNFGFNANCQHILPGVVQMPQAPDVMHVPQWSASYPANDINSDTATASSEQFQRAFAEATHAFQGMDIAFGNFASAQERVNQIYQDELAQSRRSFESALERLALKKAEADKKAYQFLLEHLTTDQQHTFIHKHYFDVRSQSGKTYRIRDETQMNVDLMHPKFADEPEATYCVVALDIPKYDQLLMQKLMLECNEKHFLSTANKTSPHHSRGYGVALGGFVDRDCPYRIGDF